MNSPSPTRSRVLVVDDIPRNLQVVGTMLRGEVAEVMEPRSGADALWKVCGAGGARPDPADLADAGHGWPGGVQAGSRPIPMSEHPHDFPSRRAMRWNTWSGIRGRGGGLHHQALQCPGAVGARADASELRHARERLREMNDEKNEFMASPPRSPQSAQRGQGHTEMLMEEGGDGPLFGTDFGLLGRIHDATQRMVEMVQNLLDVNAIERGR